MMVLTDPVAIHRATLLAAIRQHEPGSYAWCDAIKRLARWIKKGKPAPKPGRPTGQHRGEFFFQLTMSHRFEADREQLRREFQGASPGRQKELVSWALVELGVRKAAKRPAVAGPAP